MCLKNIRNEIKFHGSRLPVAGSRMKNKRGQIVSGETIKWIIYIGIIVAVGFAVKNILSRF